MATKIGVAEIDLSLVTGKFTAGVRSVKKQLTTLREKLGQTQVSARGVATAFASIGATGYVAKRIFDIGAAVEETASKFATVFGPAAEDVESQLTDIARLSGLSNERMQDLAATTGAVAQGLGFSTGASAAMAVEVQKLAGDLASFNNIPVAETSRAIQAALTGEREQLKRLGIVIREADVQQRAMRISGAKNAREITAQARAAATMQLMVERAGEAVGDLERTQNSAAAEARIVQAEMLNLRNQLAESLMPALLNTMRTFFGFVQGLQLAAAQFKINTALISEFLANTILPLIVGTEKAAEAQRNATQNLNSAWLAYDELERKIMEGVVPSLKGLAEAQDNVGTIMAEALIPMTLVTETGIDLTNSSDRLRTTLDGIQPVVGGLATVMALYANQAERAAAAKNKLNEAASKFGALGGALGFLGRFVPAIAGLASGVGTIGTAIGIASGLQNTFGAGARLDTGGGVVVNINGPGLQTLVDTIEVEQGRSRSLRRLERV